MISKFFSRIGSFFAVIWRRILQKSIVEHIFWLVGFSSKEYATIKIISFSKKRNAKVWFFNNLFFPVLIIYAPYIASIIHRKFGTLSFDKSLLELTITGSLSLVGINVLRSASTYIAEKLDESKVPLEYAGSLDNLKSEISAIKGTLKSWVFLLTVLGAFLFLIQAIQLINGDHEAIFYFVLVITVVTALSILAGRFIYLLETNYFDNEEVVRLLFRVVKNQKTDFDKLEGEIKKMGL